MTISAFLPVFNEERRIKDTMKSLMWCDEIILVDKSSTDRTVEIAASFGEKVKIYSMNNSSAYDSSEWDVFVSHCSSEWTILFTASDVIHPKLAMKIREKIKDVNFDILHIPFRRFILGVDSKKSPWYSELNPIVLRKSAIIINKGEVHGAVQKVGRAYKFSYHPVECMYHLTHETVDMMMDRHLRYWRGEANSPDISLDNSAKNVFKSAISLIFIKRLTLLGRNGLMLLFSYLTYQMMSYVYKWERQNGAAPQVYKQIRENVGDEWSSYHCEDESIINKQ